MATMTHLSDGRTPGTQKPDSNPATPGRTHRRRLRLLSPPWHELDLGDIDGYVGVARHRAWPYEPDLYWCGDANPAGFCGCLASQWRDGDTHPSRVAVYPSHDDVITAWQTFRQQRREHLGPAMPDLPYALEAYRLVDLSDWGAVPPRRSTPHPTALRP